MEQKRKKVEAVLRWSLFFFALASASFASTAQENSAKSYSVAMSGILTNYGYGAGFRFERKFSYLKSWSLRSHYLRDASSANTTNTWSLAPGYGNFYPIGTGVVRAGAFWEVGVLQTQTILSPEKQHWFTAPFAELSYAFPIYEKRFFAFSSCAFGRQFILSSSTDAVRKWNHQVSAGFYWNWGVH
jgi:hypothetical protein